LLFFHKNKDFIARLLDCFHNKRYINASMSFKTNLNRFGASTQRRELRDISAIMINIQGEGAMLL
jgi:hypothetical protein